MRNSFFIGLLLRKNSLAHFQKIGDAFNDISSV